jgi:archaellum biogenesis protein FlaJ (TadC family)
MLRRIGAILAGLVAFGAVVLLAVVTAREAWPDYAEAEPTRAYSLVMLLTRLTVGFVATLVAGLAATKVDQGSRRSPLIFGIILLMISVVWHVGIWEQYPIWYHLGWFACILPFSVIGRRLVTSASRRA